MLSHNPPRLRLQQMINSLAEGVDRPAAPASPAVKMEAGGGSRDGHPSYAGRVLQGVLAFFGERDVPSRREFQEILRKAKQASEPRDPSIQ
ncbi:MAG: hypothetical protein ACRD24_15215 [Terriglobales bacterium]